MSTPLSGTAKPNIHQMKPLLVIFLTVFIDLVGFGIIIPLSPFLAKEFGATALEVGLLMAVYSGMQFLFSPIWGGLSDRLGRRPILLVSILGTALSHLLFFYSQSLTFLFVARTLAGLFSANISTATAYIADVTDPKDRSKNMGLIGVAIGLGFVVGPALGGLTTRWGENTPALVAALVSFLNLGFAFFFLRESLSTQNGPIRKRNSRFRGILVQLQKPVVGALLVAQFMVAMAMSNMEATLFLFVADRFGFSSELASYGFAYVGICIALTQGVLVRKLLPRWGERLMMMLGFILFTLSLLLIGSSLWVWLLTIAMTILALGNGFINPSVAGSISLLSDKNEQGEVIGVYHSLAALARILGPPVGGYLYMTVHMTSPFWLSGGLGLFGLILVAKVSNRIPNAGKTQRHS